MLNILIFMIIIAVLSFLFKDKPFDGEDYFLSYKYTNIMKGIAIILVLINHIGQSYKVSVIEPLGAVGVCIFLILSGYGINEAYKRSGEKDYFIKRFKRVIIPYWIIVLLSSVLLNNFSVILIVKKLLLIELASGIFWYIRLISFWYIVFYISKKIKNINYRYIFMMMMSLFISIIFLKERMYIWQIFSFTLGVIISDNIEFFKKYIEKKLKYIIAFSLLITIVAVILKKTPYVDSRTFGVCDTALQIVISLSLAIFIGMMVYILKNIHLWGLAQFIGQKSYEIYLVHPFFLYWLTNRSLLTMILYLIIVIILSGLLNYIDNIIAKKIFINRK
ncbi:MAG: acyltransferase family protein [Clostridium sp.]